MSATLQVGRAHGARVRPVGQLVPWCSQWREKAQLEWRFQGTPAAAEVPSASPSPGATDFSFFKRFNKNRGEERMWPFSHPLLPHQQKASLNSTLI